MNVVLYNPSAVAKTLLPTHQTRQPVMPQPKPQTDCAQWDLELREGVYAICEYTKFSGWKLTNTVYAPYQVGQIYYVGEHHFTNSGGDTDYRHKPYDTQAPDSCHYYQPDEMEEEDARTYQRLDRVRGERLQSISKADAYEDIGLTENELQALSHKAWGCHEHRLYNIAVQQFKARWKAIHGKTEYRGEKNPWVWVCDWAKTDKPKEVKV